MNTKLSFRPQWSKRAMALVVAAAPLQWAFASATQSSALSQNSPFNPNRSLEKISFILS